jgi:hypothetical protein
MQSDGTLEAGTDRRTRKASKAQAHPARMPTKTKVANKASLSQPELREAMVNPKLKCRTPRA